jgi:four helix bundle protein
MDTFVFAHKRLEVWKCALLLAELTYRLTKRFPLEERFGLAAQMRRAAVSVLSNISEGASRRSRSEYIQFLHVARGSLAELDAQLELARRMEYALDTGPVEAYVRKVGQLLSGQIRALRRRESRE